MRGAYGSDLDDNVRGVLGVARESMRSIDIAQRIYKELKDNVTLEDPRCSVLVT